MPRETTLLAGVDEVGRGPLAGPVVAAAVILDPYQPIAGLMDSKKLSQRKRERLAEEIRNKALAWCLGRAEVAEIDQLNILQATFLAMRRALEALPMRPEHVLIDGNACPCLPDWSLETVIGGDNRVPVISAASILAKVSRDAEMVELHADYPDYGFAQHKGYPTRAHLQALQTFGITAHHRLSYKPIRSLQSL